MKQGYSCAPFNVLVGMLKNDEDLKTAPPLKSSQIRLFGERVIFEPVKEEMEGSILVPTGSNRGYDIGRVLIVGDGMVKKDDAFKVSDMLVAKGDYIWFQVNPFQAHNNLVKIDGTVHMTIHKHDMLARLKEPKVTFENLEFLGVWMLMEPFEDERTGPIIIPGTVQEGDVRMIRYRAVQVGSEVEGIKVGEEVIIDKKMAHAISVNGSNYFYIDSRSVAGVVKE